MTFNEYDIILKKIINLNQKNMPVATILEEKIADRLIEISKTNYKKFYRISEMLIRRIARRENKVFLKKLSENYDYFKELYEAYTKLHEKEPADSKLNFAEYALKYLK
jgi:hypothetical protein